MSVPFRRSALGALAALTMLMSATAQAQQAPKPEQLIKWRQSAYQTIAWNAARIKASVDGSYNKDEVANANLGSLFPPGTESGKGWRETTVKPTLFSDGSGVGAKSAAFVKEANELARVAQGGDLAAVKASFGSLQRTCKACHDDYRSSN